MLFLMLPAAFLLSIGTTKLPALPRWTSRALQKCFTWNNALLRKVRADEKRLAPLLSLVLIVALASLLGGLLGAVNPILPALLIAPLLSLPQWLRDVLAVRAALEDGVCASEEDRRAYEQKILTAAAQLAQKSASTLFAPLCIALIVLPFGLAPGVFWGFAALRALQEEAPWARRACAVLARWGEILMIACVIGASALCGCEPGMAWRARRQGVESVLLCAVGVDPALKSGHRPVTGDLSQSCLCVCAAVLLLIGVVSLGWMVGLRGAVI